MVIKNQSTASNGGRPATISGVMPGLPGAEILSRPKGDIEQILFSLACQTNLPGQAHLAAIALSVIDFR